jgi:AcrR family transcriptional regulator
MSLKPRSPTRKFERRREEVLAIAADLINERGARGLSLTDVARALNLDTSSVTYYFKRKELLAASCYAKALDGMEAAVDACASEPTPESRVRAYFRVNFDLFKAQRVPGAHRLAVLSDVRALDDDIRAPLDDQFLRILGKVSAYFTSGSGPNAAMESGVAAHIVIANALWIYAWADRFLDDDLERAFERFCEVFEKGLCPDGGIWPADVASLEDAVAEDDTPARFLHAATNLINEQGYRGAHVEKIAAHLGVTIGAFYHHLDNKDDLVAACCERSFSLMDRAQAIAASEGGAPGQRLCRLVATLLAHQFSASSPLLRVSAFQSLPLDIRPRMYERAERHAMHVAGLVSDGQRDGSVPALDPFIAAQVTTATVNAAADLRNWASRIAVIPDAKFYAGKLLRGLFTTQGG